MHAEDLGESFPTSIYLQKSASIQPRTSPSKFGGNYLILFNRVLSRNPGNSTGMEGATVWLKEHPVFFRRRIKKACISHGNETEGAPSFSQSNGMSADTRTSQKSADRFSRNLPTSDSFQLYFANVSM